MNSTTRFSDQELEFFKIRVEEKLAKANNDRSFIKDQINDFSDSRERTGDWVDSTSSGSELDMLYTMLSRTQKHITDLERALMRIANKTYGICSITGELIDKRRLFAVPTTTKSLAAKLKQSEVKSATTFKPKAKTRKFTPETKIPNKTAKKVRPSSIFDKEYIAKEEDFLLNEELEALNLDLEYETIQLDDTTQDIQEQGIDFEEMNMDEDVQDAIL